MPEIPEPKLKVYEGYTVTSVDKLLDREELFLTLEMAPWLNEGESKLDILTVKQDVIWVMSKFSRDLSVTSSLNPNGTEPGFYDLEYLSTEKNLLQYEEIFSFIENDINQYFSKV